MNTDLSSVLRLLLPEFLVDNFQITNIEEISSRIDIYLEENKDFPSGVDDNQLISHGFHKQVKIKDFPIRSRQVNLYVKRRRWLNKLTKEVTSKDWEVIAKGTRMTDEFASFLKGLN